MGRSHEGDKDGVSWVEIRTNGYGVGRLYPSRKPVADRYGPRLLHFEYKAGGK